MLKWDVAATDKDKTLQVTWHELSLDFLVHTSCDILDFCDVLPTSWKAYVKAFRIASRTMMQACGFVLPFKS